MTLSATNPMRTTLLSILIFEIIVFWLAFLGVIRVTEVSSGVAAAWITAASLLALLGAAGLRRGWGYWFGWAAQAAAVALGILTPWMYAMGIIFALIWIMSFILGRRLDARARDGQT